MRLDDKRAVIEVLLLSAARWNPEVFGVADALGYSLLIAQQAAHLHDEARFRMSVDKEFMYAQPATEAAYRLIESSPTLRHEWFGAP